MTIDEETNKIIYDLKTKIIDGWAMANDPICSEGFRAADKLIKFYEKRMEMYKKFYEEQLELHK